MSRRQARERILQVLFQVDVGGIDPYQAYQNIDNSFGELAKEQDFSMRIILGTLDNLQFIDHVISIVSKDWNINRMAKVDKNIMRMALYEIFYCDNIPSNVSVNEAVELGKIFGGEESGRFINGILGRVIENIVQYQPGVGLDES
ncbi:MAG: N utilization substance protein B-like protein [Pelotomaculum thermopropionicum]|uniref:Transcription antitermination protein NusB n=1 Tax=Pelotomaculum thermopropionicum TaxID=110500 RepID=A0A117M4E2_9FIRM|nr:MAG: N utilization substance protein B-like protein [Pelotomaculum thermopropionicum]